MSPRRLRPRLVGSSVVASIVVPAVRVLAETESHGEHHAPVIGDLLFPVINFAIFGFILIRYVLPAMREYLRRRREEIVASADEATSSLTAAEQTVIAAKARLAGVDGEANSIRGDIVAAATQQAERLRLHAEEDGKRRLADAALVAEQERRRALELVRAEIAALATNKAEKVIRAAMTKDDQRAFVKRFLEDAAAQ